LYKFVHVLNLSKLATYKFGQVWTSLVQVLNLSKLASYKFGQVWYKY